MFLQAVIVLIGIAALAFLLWEPHLEGRNANSTLYEVYFNDPFLAYAYIASVSFFVALYQAVKLLRYAGTSSLFSHDAVKCVRTIKFCAFAMIAFVIVGEGVLVLPNADELPPPIFMGVLIVFGSIVVATAMSLSERILKDEIRDKTGLGV